MIPPSIETLQLWVELSTEEGMSTQDMAAELRRHLYETWSVVPEPSNHPGDRMIMERRQQAEALAGHLERQAQPVTVELPHAVAEPLVAVAA